MFTINLPECGKAALELKSQDLANQLRQVLNSDPESAFDQWAHIKVLQKVLDNACKECEPYFNQVWREIAPIGRQHAIGEQVFCVIDKPEYNFAAPANDEDGLFRFKTKQIEANKAEGKVLTQELSSIKERILINHPNMTPEHKYSLVYKGTTMDVFKN